MPLSMACSMTGGYCIRHMVIDLNAGLLQPIRLYYDRDNFTAVESLVRKNAGHAIFIEK